MVRRCAVQSVAVQTLQGVHAFCVDDFDGSSPASICAVGASPPVVLTGFVLLLHHTGRWGSNPPNPALFSPTSGTTAPTITPYLVSFVPGTCTANSTGFCPSDITTSIDVSWRTEGLLRLLTFQSVWDSHCIGAGGSPYVWTVARMPHCRF